MSTRKVVRIVAYDRDGVELGAIDGDELRIKLNPIGNQLLIDNGYRSFFGEETGYTESDLTDGRDADIARMCIEVVEG